MGRNGEDQGSVEHTIVGKTTMPDKYVIECSCGAKWSHPRNMSQEEMDSIFQSHIKYFNNKTVVL